MVCERYSIVACVDPNWAEWPMPNGEQSYINGAPNLESYTDNGDGTITDNVTLLMWQKTVPTTMYAFSAAVTYCSTLTVGNYGGWRLPSSIELVSIVDYDAVSPAINVAFPSTPSNYFWSATSVGGSSSKIWAVLFGDGSNTTVDTSAGMLNVRCVR
ncbi:MAG TPA: DUF1566 domain-containing protein [Polyangia bacterium]|nr:DUF1566 domain-containing protein [Polyangia bacterium]